MKIPFKLLISHLEEYAPKKLQENYDNSGLIVGDPEREISSALLSLDCTYAVVQEAIKRGCSAIISHHPVIFGSGLKSITGKSETERIILLALKNDIALYAIHTNLDKVVNGVNGKIAEKLGLKDLEILDPEPCTLRKLVTFVPQSHVNSLRDALFAAGGGRIGGYDECSFSLTGNGTFRPGESTNPFLGQKGSRSEEQEVRLEMLCSVFKEQEVLSALRKHHPYEEVAFDLIPVELFDPHFGSGLLGRFEHGMTEKAFLAHVKSTMNVNTIRHTAFLGRKIEKVALCGGAGSFLLKRSIQKSANALVTADFKYHQFFDTENSILVADIGHYESEQFTPELIKDILSKKFPTFALLLSETNSNPINYYS